MLLLPDCIEAVAAVYRMKDWRSKRAAVLIVA